MFRENYIIHTFICIKKNDLQNYNSISEKLTEISFPKLSRFSDEFVYIWPFIVDIGKTRRHHVTSQLLSVGALKMDSQANGDIEEEMYGYNSKSPTVCAIKTGEITIRVLLCTEYYKCHGVNSGMFTFHTILSSKQRFCTRTPLASLVSSLTPDNATFYPVVRLLISLQYINDLCTIICNLPIQFLMKVPVFG